MSEDSTTPVPNAEALRAASERFARDTDVHRPALHRLGWGLTGNPFDAEDLVQEALVRTWARLLRDPRPIADYRSYLLRAMTRAFIDAGRRRRPTADPDLDAQPADDAPPWAGPVVAEALARLVEALPPRQRVAVLLKDVFDMPIAAVAETLCVSEGGAKALLSRGRTSLRRRRQDASMPEPVEPAHLRPLLEAFRAKDVGRVVSLLAPDATSRVVGITETEAGGLPEDVVRHTLVDETIASCVAVRLFGVDLLVLGYGPRDTVGDVFTVDADERGPTSLVTWYYCPEVLTAVAHALDREVRSNGYRLAAVPGD